MIIYKGIVCQLLKYGARELGKASKNIDKLFVRDFTKPQKEYLK